MVMKGMVELMVYFPVSVRGKGSKIKIYKPQHIGDLVDGNLFSNYNRREASGLDKE